MPVLQIDVVLPPRLRFKIVLLLLERQTSSSRVPALVTRSILARAAQLVIGRAVLVPRLARLRGVRISSMAAITGRLSWSTMAGERSVVVQRAIVRRINENTVWRGSSVGSVRAPSGESNNWMILNGMRSSVDDMGSYDLMSYMMCYVIIIIIIYMYFKNVSFSSLRVRRLLHIESLHISLNIAHSGCRPNNFMSSFTFSSQVFLPLPKHFIPATSL